jgi:broad-specificity NMP kinase
VKVLVTGQAGSGKSSVAAELSRRGFAAYDTDAMPDVTGFDSLETGEPASWEEIDHPIDFRRVADPAEAEPVLAHNDVIADEWRAHGAIPIDSARPLTQVVDEILAHAYGGGDASATAGT